MKVLTSLAVFLFLVTGCGHEAEPAVSVSASTDMPFTVQMGPTQFESGNNLWFQHTVTLTNTADEAISIDDNRSGELIGSNSLLVTSGPCGPGSPNGPSPLPTIGCTANAVGNVQIAPHSTAVMTTVHAYKGISGMPALVPGLYVWDKAFQWQYEKETTLNNSHIVLTYDVRN